MTKRKPLSVLLLFGGIAILVMLSITFMAYRGGPTAFLDQAIILINLIPLVCGVIASFIKRKQQGGYLEFREALKIIFGILAMALTVQVLFVFLLSHVFDPPFGKALGPASLVKTEAAYRRFGMPEDEISRNIDALRGTDPFSARNSFLGLAWYCVLGFPVSLILAAVIKRKKPANQPTTTT